ncbi:hypothetical protein BDV12DRAFT_175472 [Aspergillus spectabilis]
MIEFLLDHCRKDQAALRFSALESAIDAGQLAMTEWLLDRGGFDPNLTRPDLPQGLLFAMIGYNKYPKPQKLHALKARWCRRE